jgi:DNA-binding transcriptional ArsR family regulator
MVNFMDRERFSKICKALGHPARVRIVEYLQASDQCICGEIVEILPLAQSTVSQHLKVLKESGLVKGEIEGPRTCYCLDRTVMDVFKNKAKNL